MANRDLVKRLQESGIDNWNQWRERVPDAVLDFTGASFTGANLAGVDLRKAYLGGADFRGADLRGADLTEARLDRADLKGTHLEGVDLRGAKGLRQEQINGACGDKNTDLPPNLQRPSHWTSYCEEKGWLFVQGEPSRREPDTVRGCGKT